MESNLVSVIITSYNNSHYYSECLESVLSQSYGNIEIIIADDGSQNFNKSLIVNYIEENKKNNISNYNVYSNARNMGIVKNFNTAIKKSKGEYIITLAIDDALKDKNVITDIVEFFNQNDCLICTGYVEVYDNTMSKFIQNRPNEGATNLIKNLKPKELFKVLAGENFISALATNYKKEFFVKYGYCDESYTMLEDWTKMLYVLRNGCKVYYMDRCIAKYRLGGISTNGGLSEDLLNDIKKMKKEVDQYIGIDVNKLDKSIIVWGTGYWYGIMKYKLSNVKIEYFIDSSEQKQGNLLDGVKIYSPERILLENNKNNFIIICSSYYLEISNWLEKHNFKGYIDYASIYCIK